MKEDDFKLGEHQYNNVLPLWWGGRHSRQAFNFFPDGRIIGREHLTFKKLELRAKNNCLKFFQSKNNAFEHRLITYQ